MPEDAAAILQIDRSFSTDTIFTAYCDTHQMGIRLTPTDSTVTKSFPLEDLSQEDRPWELAVVAVDGDEICGFLAAGYQAWNRRLTLWHLYVDSACRGRGIARLLVDRAQAYAIEKGAVHLWLEASNLNVPAIAMYRKLGFALCGMDTTLYQGTPASAETALFLARPVAGFESLT